MTGTQLVNIKFNDITEEKVGFLGLDKNRFPCRGKAGITLNM
jgi:hypothetical protein